MITSQNLGSNSNVNAFLLVFSQANNVLPLPPKGSNIISSSLEEFFNASSIKAKGFCVGCLYLAWLSLLMFQIVDLVLPP
jgi:hypothetical protein